MDEVLNRFDSHNWHTSKMSLTHGCELFEVHARPPCRQQVQTVVHQILSLAGCNKMHLCGLVPLKIRGSAQQEPAASTSTTETSVF